MTTMLAEKPIVRKQIVSNEIASKKQTGLNETVPKRPISSNEIVAFCPKCKTLETLYLEGANLAQTQKFNQRGNQIYHDCGSDKPCRLYRTI
jgi:RecG-like helicase